MALLAAMFIIPFSYRLCGTCHKDVTGQWDIITISIRNDAKIRLAT